MKYSFYTIVLAFLLVACQSNNSTKTEKVIADTDTMTNTSITTTPSEREKERREPEFEEGDLDYDQKFEWTGTINSSIAIHGYYELANGYMDSGVDIWVGELIYDKVGKPIKIIGQNKSDGGIEFLEMDKGGNITGIFSSEGNGKNVSKGTWYSPVNKESLSLEIKETPIENNQYHEIRPKRTKDIIGKYHYEYGKEGDFGTLNVYAIEDDQITLDLLCVTAEPSRNIASIEEKITLPIVNHTAYIDWSENCHFTIRFFDGFAVIDYRVDKDDCDFGHNAYVEGIFLKIE